MSLRQYANQDSAFYSSYVIRLRPSGMCPFKKNRRQMIYLCNLDVLKVKKIVKQYR